MEQLRQRLASIQGVRILSREQLKKISGGTSNYVFNYNCECMQGGAVSILTCAQCETYCSTRGGQTSTSDCCTGLCHADDDEG